MSWKFRKDLKSECVHLEVKGIQMYSKPRGKQECQGRKDPRIGYGLYP